jgi:glycosyltransferase involved in cell wall biosynthesis
MREHTDNHEGPAPATGGDRPIRIGYVIGQLTRGGAERQLYELVKGLDRARFPCVVYCLSEDVAPYGDLLAATGAPVRILSRARRLDVGRALALARLARADNLQILHSFLIHASGYAWPAQRMARVPHLITSARNCRPAGFLRDRIIRRAFRASDAVVCNGEAVRAFVARHYGTAPARCRVIHNGVDLGRFAPPGPGADREPGPVIATVGRLVPQKDLPLFLEAAALLRRAVPASRFRVIGDGPGRAALEQAAAGLGLADAVAFLGERADVPDLLRSADVFWLTSAWEGLPNVLLEAQASALPVVARDVGAAREVVRHGVTGYLVEGRDAGEFASRTRGLLAHPEEALAMGRAGRRRVEDAFSLEAMVRSTERLYRDVAGRRE